MGKNRIIVVYEGKYPNIKHTGYEVRNISTKDLDSFSSSTNTRIGVFPALLDINSGVWCPIDGPMSEMETKLDGIIQDRKSDDQKAYENKFFLLCKDILTAVGDPRASEVPIPKLGMDELATLIESCEAIDFNASIKFSIKLLSMDAALRRYNISWWDNAVAYSSI